MLSRFERLNNSNSLAKPSFLNQNLYGSWHSGSDYKDPNDRTFATVFYRNENKQFISQNEFTKLINKIFSEDGGKEIKAIQAYRDHRIPLTVTNSRKIFVHCMEYRDSKYYSFIKNGIINHNP